LRATTPCVPIGEPLTDQYLDRVTDFVPDPQAAAHHADIVLLSHSDEQPRTTLIDVTMAAHNAQHADPDYHPGSSAIHRAAQKHASYDAEFIEADPDVKLVVFAVETSGALHKEAHQFLLPLANHPRYNAVTYRKLPLDHFIDSPPPISLWPHRLLTRYLKAGSGTLRLVPSAFRVLRSLYLCKFY